VTTGRAVPASLILSRRDLEFLLYEWLDVAALTARPRFAEHSRDTFDDVIDLAERIAAQDFQPHYRAGDLCEPHLAGGRVVLVPEVAAALDRLTRSGLMAGAFDEEFGGAQLPAVVAKAANLWLQAANPATSAYPLLTAAAAGLLLARASTGQIDTWARPMIEGRYFATMCLSEPQAGSSLADIVTRAEPQADGTFRLFGTKMWISGGEHELGENIVHLVLAKIPGGPPGVGGISLFIVPKVLASGERNDITLAGLNHKMGFRGTVNAVLAFGDGGHRPGGDVGAVGYLVGEPHDGLTAMFHMMNEARIGVGLCAAALGYTGYLHSLDYARTRVQGRPAGADRDGAPVPIVEHADVRRMLLAQKAYAEGALALGLYCARLLDEQRTGATDADRETAGLLLDVLTPIAKSWPSQWCLQANHLAIQVLGGYGYTRDFPVEQFYRDNRLNMIHEGTHGVQAADLLGRKIPGRGGACLTALAGAIRATVARAAAGPGEARLYAAELAAALDRFADVTATLAAVPDPATRLANASTYLEAVGHLVIAWLWLEQVLAAAAGTEPVHDGKRRAAAYFYRWELPKTRAMFDLLADLDRTILDTPSAVL
jgi:alkylation response protein AidB-like acyl-CoA dehydrogenase